MQITGITKEDDPPVALFFYKLLRLLIIDHLI